MSKGCGAEADTGAGFAGVVNSGSGCAGAGASSVVCASGKLPDSFKAQLKVGISNKIQQQLESSRLAIIIYKPPYSLLA